MTPRRIMLSVLLAGLVALGIGVYPYIKYFKIDPARKLLSIPFTPWFEANWDEYGPGLELNVNRNPSYIWMRKAGYITYTVAVGKTVLQGKEAILTAKLSSELEKITSNDIDFSSDVTLYVNDNEIATQNVIPDNGVGIDYIWRVPSTAFLGNEINKITFRVKQDAFYKNGLCIYGPIQIRFE